MRVRSVVVCWCAVSLLMAVNLVATSGSDRLAVSGLIDAIKDRDPSAVRALLKARADVNAAQGDGATALHWAVHLDELEVVDMLLRAGARVNVANDDGVTPLYLACTNRNSSLVEKLLAAGANPNATLLNGETVLMNCARTGNAAAVRGLLVHGADVNAKEPSHSQTALMWAAAERHPEVTKVLIEAGADIHARARIYSQTVTSEVTQRAGREELNYTALRGGSTPLLFAARSGDVESARALLMAGADPNETLPNGMSTLVEAAHSGNGAVAILLLEKGADPTAAAIGYTALHAAILRSDLALVKALVAHKADLNAVITKGTPLRRNNEDFNLPATLIGATPFFLAAKFAEPEIMHALAAAGADVKVALKDGTTPLMAAAGMGASPESDRRGLSNLDGGRIEPESQVLEAVRAALGQPVDVNAVNQAGDTALHGAALQGYDHVVQLLVEMGAQINAKNKRGQTPLAVLAGGAGAGRRGGARSDAAALAAADPAVYQPAAHQSTVDLLRALGAQQ